MKKEIKKRKLVLYIAIAAGIALVVGYFVFTIFQI